MSPTWFVSCYFSVFADWKRCIDDNLTISIYRGFKDNIKFSENDAKEALFSDDFEIIYDSEFTLEELRDIFRGRQKSDNELMEKLCKNINDREFLKNKYGIEV